ncbi:hypothetical protein MAPG_02063 [Magnaporthiopsis poae ATCC 64411]|uniref:Uncharacterized protein n=1 Tax=Magnaporthiopsis poae (strain ATCC 64411 / 73-15) TaxID=644358 RepID=A0A0C4DQC4_MAGP6|nr:hypothetical protein MAPG_02063 [Magnaporthiopsis poae ATCC 64411]
MFGAHLPIITNKAQKRRGSHVAVASQLLVRVRGGLGPGENDVLLEAQQPRGAGLLRSLFSASSDQHGVGAVGGCLRPRKCAARPAGGGTTRLLRPLMMTSWEVPAMEQG